jgi:DAACS family dicarboxylate/amino acid:cation (Na+ or H+) symporter
MMTANLHSLDKISRNTKKASLFSRTLPLQMLIGMFVGCLIGHFYPDVGMSITPIRDAFITALKMIVVPLVFASITLGVYNMGRNVSVLGRMVGVVFLWFLIATGFCIVLGLCLNFIFHPGIGADLTVAGVIPVQAGVHPNISQFFLDLIPGNIVSAMAQQKVLQVLIFGVLFGAALSKIGTVGDNVAELIHGIQLAMMKIVQWIIAFAPIAVLAAMSWLFATQGVSTLFALAKLVMTMYAGLGVVVLVMWLVIFACGHNPFSVTRKISSALLLAFTTRSSEATLPILMEALEDKMKIQNKVVSTVLPLGYSFNQDGTSLYISLAVAFVVEAHHITLTMPGIFTIIVTGLIATKGMANVSGGGLLAATTVLLALGLPIDSVAILAATDIFLDMGRTTINVFGNTVAVILVDRFSKNKADTIAGH